jgi:hypothetical protein
MLPIAFATPFSVHGNCSMERQKVVVFYNTMWDEPLDYPQAEIPEGYVLTTDKAMISQAVAVVFHFPSLSRIGAIEKRKGQLWVAWSMECELNYHPLYSCSAFMKSFDLTMTYHREADIVVPYLRYDCKELLRTPAGNKDPERLAVAFISSPFNASRRFEYLSALMHLFDVHSYGKVFNNRVLKSDSGVRSRLETIAKYKFTIAFENSVAQDYVTEKFFDPLLAGSVPVYLGAPNVDAFAPGDHCFINTADFPNPDSLAEYLRFLSRDASAYQRYFEWKSKPFRPDFIKLIDSQKEHPFVRLCREIEVHRAQSLRTSSPDVTREDSRI